MVSLMEATATAETFLLVLLLSCIISEDNDLVDDSCSVAAVVANTQTRSAKDFATGQALAHEVIFEVRGRLLVIGEQR